MVFSAEKHQFLLQHRVQFFHCHDLIKAVHELKHQLFRRGVGRGNLDYTRALVSVQRFHDKLITDSMGDDSLDSFLLFPVQQVETVTAEVISDYRIARLNHPVVCIGQAREDNPFVGIFHESLWCRKTDTFL